MTKRPPKTAEQKKAEWATLARIGGVFLLIIFWWFIYDMQADIWIYFTRDHVNLNLWPFDVTLKPEMQWVNPALIIALHADLQLALELSCRSGAAARRCPPPRRCCSASS